MIHRSNGNVESLIEVLCLLRRKESRKGDEEKLGSSVVSTSIALAVNKLDLGLGQLLLDVIIHVILISHDWMPRVVWEFVNECFRLRKQLQSSSAWISQTELAFE